MPLTCLNNPSTSCAPSHTPNAAPTSHAPSPNATQPCMVFVGEQFESAPPFKLARSMLLDFFRGQQVASINLAGLDRVLVVFALGEAGVLVRQYGIRCKKSGTKTPRVALAEMGPRLELVLRRTRLPSADLEAEAMKRAKLTKKKVRVCGVGVCGGERVEGCTGLCAWGLCATWVCAEVFLCAGQCVPCYALGAREWGAGVCMCVCTYWSNMCAWGMWWRCVTGQGVCMYSCVVVCV